MSSALMDKLHLSVPETKLLQTMQRSSSSFRASSADASGSNVIELDWKPLNGYYNCAVLCFLLALYVYMHDTKKAKFP
jgi:hypothetical protein